MLVRFKSALGANLEQDFILVGNGSDIERLSIKAPINDGDYSFQAQLLKDDDKWSGLANDNVDVSVAKGTVTEPVEPPVEGNSVSIINPPTSVKAGEIVNLDINYTNNSGSAYVLVRFKDSNGKNLEQDFEPVGNGSGTKPLSIKAPTSIGSYSFQAQLLKDDDKWSGLANDNVDVSVANGPVTEPVEPPVGGNTLEIINTSTAPINYGTVREVSINYNLQDRARVLVEVWNTNKAGNGVKIGQVYRIVEPGARTESFSLIIDTFPGDTNTIQALLFEPNAVSEDWVQIPINNIPSISVSKGDGTIIYRGQAYNYDNSQNLLFEESLGDGYYSNWFVNNEWQGSLSAKFEDNSRRAWVDWENDGHSGESHAEFDIKIQKYSWHEDKDVVNHNYPTQIQNISGALDCSFKGQWSSDSEGRAFINMTAWIYSEKVLGGDNIKKSDIIVHAWDNSGNLASKYKANPNDALEYLDTISSGNITYHVLKRNTGGYNEVATYNIVPVNPRGEVGWNGEWNSAFSTSPFERNINMKDIINQLISRDENSSTPDISDNWWLHGLEWTVGGSSEDTNVGGVSVKDSKGRFTFTSYSIPDITRSTALKTQITQKDLIVEAKDFSVSPNPFINSFEYEYSVKNYDEVTVDLYALNGRKIEALKNKESHRPGNYSDVVDTSDLDAGIYILRINTSEGEEAIKLIKN
ncbi:T9SS type A sorting domain-containing protein [Zobellia nedashkovskayae]